MRVIDSDAHVVETEHTWDYMDKSDQKYRPVLVKPAGAKREYWFIDGKVRGFARSVITAQEFKEVSQRAGRLVDTPADAREMENVPARLRHMDQLGVDIQVLYPSIFIEQTTDKPEVDVAICGGFNRWMASIWKQSNNRLPWVCALPLLSMKDSLDMLPFCKDNGAVAVQMRPIEGEMLLPNPYFYPLYEKMSGLSMPLAIHVANGNPYVAEITGQRNFSAGFWKFRLPVVGSFHAIVYSGLADMFPKLRFAFVEASAQWVPYLLRDLKRRLPPEGRPWPENPMEHWRLFVTCQMEDDIPYLMKECGEENIVVGTDYGHNDPSTEIEVHRTLREESGVTHEQYRKIVDSNAVALYDL